MRIRAWAVLIAAVVALALPLFVFSDEGEDARSVGCLPAHNAKEPHSACVKCHKADAEKRWKSNHKRPCTPYCGTCHKAAEMKRHHPVGIKLSRKPDRDEDEEHDDDDDKMPLAGEEMKMACVTCHEMSRPRHDGVRWKAASMFDRLFRAEKRYKTYFLSKRNDHGQLCLSCH